MHEHGLDARSHERDAGALAPADESRAASILDRAQQQVLSRALAGGPRATFERIVRKVYVLDTNVLLHDPRAIFKFEDNEVVLPIYVIEEIDTSSAT